MDDLVAFGDFDADAEPVDVLEVVGVAVNETVPVFEAVPDALTDPDFVTVGVVEPDLVDVGDVDGEGDSDAADDCEGDGDVDVVREPIGVLVAGGDLVAVAEFVPDDEAVAVDDLLAVGVEDVVPLVVAVFDAEAD